MKTAGSKAIRLIALIVLPAALSAPGASAQSKTWTSPPAAQRVPNPVPANASTVAAGKTLYMTYCTPCHGNKGKGDGPAAASLNPKPADHTSAAVQSETDGSLFWKMSEGHNPMPQYKAMLTETQRWQLVDYIRSLAKQGKK